MGFIKEYVVITKKELIPKYQSIKSKHKIVALNERDILGARYQDFKKAPHQKKNWMLRSSLADINGIDDEFIMLDDDNLPIRKIPKSFFVEKGRYKAYYYNDLLNWKYLLSSYDVGQQETAEILRKHNLELLSYSSHMPQIINKRIYKEVVNFFREESFDNELDEWSTYFNYATVNYPHLYEKKPYLTLNWPAHPNDWQTPYMPKKFMYENYYDHIYDKIFKDLKLISGAEKKVKRKAIQLRPYKKTDELKENIFQFCSGQNLVHGSMIFKGDNGEKVIISNIPYIFAATPDTVRWIKVPYKIIDPDKLATYKLVLQNSAGSTRGTKLLTRTRYRVKGYEEGIIELPVHAALFGVKNLNFAVKKNDKDMLAQDGRYDSMMLSCKYNSDIQDAVASLTQEDFTRTIP